MIETDLRLEFPAPGGGRVAFRYEYALPGEGITAVTGPSGAGKTTFLRCLAGLTRARGRVAVEGRTWQDDTVFLPAHRRPVGYVFQEASLFPHLTVRQNLAYGARRGPKRPGAGGRGVDLGRLVEILGLGPLMGRRPATLSGGERQRVALARAMFSAPSLLLLDEPLASLDQARKEEIMPFLEGLRHLTLPIIYVSHSLEEIERLADTVIRMEARA